MSQLARIKDGGIHLANPKLATRSHATFNDHLRDKGAGTILFIGGVLDPSVGP